VSASTSHDSSHLSIGEVLNILREEFPDITISKIRFLESQGLIDPERTPSGYRKFYEADVSRLRWILHQQKENFLPLKVIKERLEHMGDDEQSAAVRSIVRPGRADGPDGRPRPRRRTARGSELAPPLPLGDPASDGGDGDDSGPPPAKMGLTRRELARATGLEEWQLAELESFGLVTPVAYAGDDAFFDDEGKAVAKAAAGFYAHGIGARHLRMYKHFAEREAALFEQVLMQYLRQRNPDARAKAQVELASLSKLGRALRAALLVHAVRDSLAE
jgi:DNA-binding transcriptional MerR regulator